MDDLETLYARVSQAATEQGLPVFDGLPNLTGFSHVTWMGDWPEYLHLAVNARASLLYLQARRYSPEELTEQIVSEWMEFTDVDEEGDDPAVEDGMGWLRGRLQEATIPWNRHRDETTLVKGVWFKDGIAHIWCHETDWVSKHRAAVEAAISQAHAVEHEDRVLRSREEALLLHVYATELAKHLRFPEANSQDKREFMAEQLFGSTIKDGAGAASLTTYAIARRATLVYWWEIEPTERVTTAERARKLREQGESIRNIAATLKISDAKVRTALADS